MPPPESMTYVIDHKEPALKILTTQKGQQGEITNERNVTTDGKDNVNKMRMPMGETDVKSTTKWADKTLTTGFKLDMQGMALDIVESWKLSDDGKVLTILARDWHRPGQLRRDHGLQQAIVLVFLYPVRPDGPGYTPFPAHG